jgi:hypothetical protein
MSSHHTPVNTNHTSSYCSLLLRTSANACLSSTETFTTYARVAPLQPQQQLNGPGGGGRGGGGGRRGALGGVVERGGVQKHGFASGSTLYQNSKSASAAARLGDATLDAGAARAFGFLPNMTSASGLGSTNPPHGSLSASTTSASGLGLNNHLHGSLSASTSASGLGPNNPLHGSSSASTTFASGPGINTLLPNAADSSPAALPTYVEIVAKHPDNVKAASFIVFSLHLQVYAVRYS